MKKRSLLGLFIGLILTTMLVVPSAWSEEVLFFGKPVEIMLLKDIGPGMTGYGLTVFEGTLVEEFQGEVVSVTEEDGNTHIIWIRPTSSPKDILKRAGIIAGMSGSSIYLFLDDEITGQEKLAGALAYGFGFQPFEEALAGVTPIEEMLRLEELKKIYEQNENLVQEIKKVSVTHLNQLRVPMIISGLDPRVAKIFKEDLIKETGLKEENFNFIELKTGGHGGSQNTDTSTSTATHLKNGDAIAGVLAKGAVNIAGIGTVTLSNEIAFVAFGHPFFWTGKTNIPAFGAEIAMIVPSMQDSFKYRKGIIGPQLGTIEVDSLEGILGTWHPGKNTMLPIRITLTKSYLGGLEKTEEFNTDIAPKAPVSSSIFFSVVLNSIFIGAPDLDNVSVELETKFTYLDKNNLEQEVIFPKKFFARDWVDVYLGLISLYRYYTMFSKAKIELVEINIDAKITQEKTEIPVLYLSDIDVEPKRARPNEEITLGLMLSDEKKSYSKTLKIQAPNFQGEVKIRVQDKNSRLDYLIYEALNEPAKIDEVLKFAKISAGRENILYVEIQYIKSIAEREGVDNKGWKETIKRIDELTNTEIKEIELPEITEKFNLSSSIQLIVPVEKSVNIEEIVKNIVEKTKDNNTIKFKPGLFIDPPFGLFSDLDGNLRMNLVGVDVGLLKYKRLQIFNFGLGVATNMNKIELYGKFAPVKINLWKSLFAEANIGINNNGKVLFGLGFSLKIK